MGVMDGVKVGSGEDVCVGCKVAVDVGPADGVGNSVTFID